MINLLTRSSGLETPVFKIDADGGSITHTTKIRPSQRSKPLTGYSGHIGAGIALQATWNRYSVGAVPVVCDSTPIWWRRRLL